MDFYIRLQVQSRYITKPMQIFEKKLDYLHNSSITFTTHLCIKKQSFRSSQKPEGEKEEISTSLQVFSPHTL
jgi:hypothetical protein